LIWRIRDRDVFRRLTAEGRRTRAGVLWCTYLPDPSASPPRVAFAIGRAIGPAVARNLARRRLRQLLSNASLPPGWYLIGARPNIAERTFAELRRDVMTLRDRVATPSTDAPAATSAPGSSPPPPR
jgi:ribonuclease P protein component